MLLNAIKNRKGIYILSLIFITVLLNVLLISGYKLFGIILSPQLQQEEEYYAYSSSQEISYKVNLKENEFIPKEYLGMNLSYITEVVDNIAVDFEFTFDGIDNTAIVYDYTIIGVLTGRYEDREDGNKLVPVWIEEYELVALSTDSSNDFEISKSVGIDLEKINKRVIAFEKSMKLVVDAEYKVVMVVNITGEKDGQKIKEKHQADINFPLYKEVFKINKMDFPEEQKILTVGIEKAEINQIELIVSVLAFALAILGLIKLISLTFIKKRKTKYDMMLNQILKDYSNRIVMVKSIPECLETKNIEVTSFGELIDLVNEMSLPILCIENFERQTHFCVIKGEVTYHYILKKETGKE